MLKNSYMIAQVASLLLGWCCSGRAAHVELDNSLSPEVQCRVVSESSREIVLDLCFGAIQVDTLTDDDGAWAQLSVAGMGKTSRCGWPELPQYTAWLRLAWPQSRVEILDSSVVLRNFGRVIPAPEPFYRSDHGEPRRLPDPSCYLTRSRYPTALADIVVGGAIGRDRVAAVTFTPVAYDAETHDLHICTRLRVRVVPQSSDRLDSRNSQSPAFAGLVSHLVLNARETEPLLAPSFSRMLLVTEPPFLSALQPLIDWKTRSGVPVRVLIASQLGSTADELRASIAQLVDTAAVLPEFLLLVGDVDAVPTFYGVNSSLTDHPYSTIIGTDYLPDISVGRLPCASAEQCADWVQRVIRYERDGDLPSPLSAVVFSSASAQDPARGDQVAALAEGARLRVMRLQEPETGSLAELMTALDSLPAWVFYIGHGFPQAWSSVRPHFTTSEVDLLGETSSAMVIAIACATADLDFPPVSLAEFWQTRVTHQSLLTYVGATENTAFYRSDTLGMAMMEAVFQQGFERLGPAVDYGRLRTAQSFPQAPGGLTEETIQQFVLLGDPSMRLFTSSPQNLHVTYPAAVPLNSGSIAVNVRMNTRPLPGAEICLSSLTGIYYQVSQTDAAGQAFFSCPFASPAALQLVVSARNARPTIGNIHVVPNNRPYLDLAGVRVIDSEGDNDGHLDRGEISRLQLAVTNLGTETSPSSSLTVSADDSLLALLPVAVPFSQVAPNDTLWLDSTVTVVVAEDAPDLEPSLLSIQFPPDDYGERGVVWPMQLHAPEIAYLRADAFEDSGDGDRQAELGERFALRLQFVNRGSDRAISPQCSLTINGPYLRLVTTISAGSDLAPHDTLMADFIVAVDSTLPRGYEGALAYTLRGMNIGEQEGHGAVRVGQVPVFLYVLDRMPQQVDAVEDALTALGVENERGAILPGDLNRYASVWIFSGMFPNSAALAADAANQLSDYLDHGGRCYWEGGDVWAFDPPTRLHPYFHIHGVSDGTSNAGPIAGVSGTPFAGLTFDYAGENSFVDQLEPLDGAREFLQNDREGARYSIAVGYQDSIYRSLGCSIELGSLVDGSPPATRVHLLSRMLTFFDIEVNEDTHPPTIHHDPPEEVQHTSDGVHLIADIQDPSGVARAQCEYTIGDDVTQTRNMSYEGGVYTVVMEGLPSDGLVRYRFRATDGSPLQNTAGSEMYTLHVEALPNLALEISRDDLADPLLRSHIECEDSCSWAVTEYPEGVPVLELHAANGRAVAFRTEAFDASHLAHIELAFWHYLRSLTPGPGMMARVIASTDGGVTFPHRVWEIVPPPSHSEEGFVDVLDLTECAGRSNVVLKFVLSGEGYWRLRDLLVSGSTFPRRIPVPGVVISFRSGGITLHWPRVNDARYYEVSARSPADDTTFYSVAHVVDTVYTDLELSAAIRFYRVTAVVEEATPSGCLIREDLLARTPAVIRQPDLRWNAKLERLR